MIFNMFTTTLLSVLVYKTVTIGEDNGRSEFGVSFETMLILT